MLTLPTVTLCAAASVNVRATVAALRACLDQVEFAECLLFTDAGEAVWDDRIDVVPIPRLGSGRAYSDFMLVGLADHVRTNHCLIVQWDGFVVNAEAWQDAFLAYDYVGAPWPQFGDSGVVGNGGFSLRSRRLLKACKDDRFVRHHPEDVAICRTNRDILEQEHAIRFADPVTAAAFAHERGPEPSATFGFHGIFNMIPRLGCDAFWEIYETLDDRATARVDYRLLFRQLGACRSSWKKRLQLAKDLLLKR